MKASRPLSGPAQWLALALLAFVCIYASLIPLAPGGALAAPDLLYCLFAACVYRRRAPAPIWLLAALGLLADLMLARPVGLGALTFVLAIEALRRAAPLVRGGPFALEWLAVGLGFALQLAIISVMMRLSFLEGPSVEVMLRYGVATMIAYPMVCLALAWGPGLRAPRTGSGGFTKVRR